MPALPRVLPAARLGPYAPFGPDGYGVIKRAFLTLSWQDASTALPLVFRVETTADDLVANAFTLTLDRVAPGAPVAGDFWLDTAQTDPSLGNATAGVTIASDGGYLLKTYTAAGAWVQVAGIGATGRRVTLPLPLVRKPAARVEVGVTCLAAGGRFAIEGLGLDPGSGVEAA